MCYARSVAIGAVPLSGRIAIILSKITFLNQIKEVRETQLNKSSFDWKLVFYALEPGLNTTK